MKNTLAFAGSFIRCALLTVVAVMAFASAQVFGQVTVYNVTNANASGPGSLSAAIAAANASTNVSFLIQINPGLTIQPSAQLFITPSAAAQSNNAVLTIAGGGSTIDMSLANGGAGDRAFFIAGGNVFLNNLTIANGKAQGGAGTDGGGGGAGLGGAIFVANGAAITGGNVTVPAVVTLAGVNFTNNTAIGGNGGTITVSGAGGGGGMGGNGGLTHVGDVGDTGGGGGGGFGVGANGGSNAPGLAGAFLGGASAGTGGSGSPGGINGGGGGGANGDGSPETGSNKAGGGGGVDGKTGEVESGSGGTGGFGGGGGGSGLGGNFGGWGGFGGGGGGGNWVGDESGTLGGNGGFGGGGGFGYNENKAESGGGLRGFGAGGGAGDSFDPPGPARYGGGGLGAGGAIFVMDGASLIIQSGNFGGNTVTAGLGSPDNNPDNPLYNSQNGSTYGADLFLGANVTFDIATGQSVSLNSLGGAGNLADPNVSGAPSGQLAQADGGVIKTGGGNLILTGTNYYSGATIVNAGVLELGSGASETGTTSVIIGQNPGDNGTMILGSGSSLTGGSLVLGQSSNSVGTLIFGAGNAGVVDFGTTPITTGAGSGTIVFSQSARPDGSAGAYEFTPVLNGNISILQGGTGITRLAPGGVSLANNFTGSITIESGTLQIGNVYAIPNTAPLTVNGGALDLNGYDGFFSTIQMNGGAITNSGPGPVAFTANQITTVSGQIHAPITGNEAGTFVLQQSGNGTTTIFSGESNILGGDVQADAGNLVIGTNAALLNIENMTLTGSGSITFQGRNASETQNVTVGQDANANSSLVLDGGKLRVTSGNGVILGQSGSLVFSGAGGELQATQIAAGNGAGKIVFSQTNTMTMSMPMDGSLSLVQNGPGTTVLQNQTTNGLTTINAGTLLISTGLPSFNLSVGSTLILNNGTLNLSNAVVSSGSFEMNGGLLTGSSSGQLALQGNFNAYGQGTIAAIVDTPSFAKSGNGTLTVNASIYADTAQIYMGAVALADGGELLSDSDITLTGGRLEIGQGSRVAADSVNISGGARLSLGTSNGINDNTALSLGHGVLATTISLTETMGALTIHGHSRIDFMGNSASLTFSTLSLNGTLSIWNYSPDDTLTITSGSAFGSLDDITFYSDSGVTSLGTAMFEGNNIMPVPEPSTYALLALAAAALVVRLWRRRAGNIS